MEYPLPSIIVPNKMESQEFLFLKLYPSNPIQDIRGVLEGDYCECFNFKLSSVWKSFRLLQLRQHSR